MSDPLTALIAGGAAIGGGAISALGSMIGGNQAAQVQRETNAMTVDLANTAHQREVQDLKKAGLNPLLSGTGGQGANTPTLKAPTQSAEGVSKGAESLGNSMATLPSQIMQYMTGQQQIELQKANADKIKAETENLKETGKYIAPQAELTLLQGEQNVIESTQRTNESKARQATIEALRQPQVQSMIQQTAESTQRTKTEIQRTRELTEAANNARELFGARAKEASTLAAQISTYYNQFFLREHQQKIDEKDLQIELLTTENGIKLIQYILDNEYGHLDRMTKIMDNPFKAGASLAASASQKGPVLTNRIERNTRR